jgi:hypothetical protein
MRIVFTGEDIAPVVLIGTDPNGGPEAVGPIGRMRVNGAWEIQPAPAVRAAAKAFHNRDNQSTELTFTARREHESAAAARRFALTHAASMPTGNDHKLVIEDGDLRMQLTTARLQSLTLDGEGVETLHTYTLVGGQLTEDLTL